MNVDSLGWASQVRDRILHLGQVIETTVERELDGVSACALLDFPDHSNVGDHAIWLGELTLLERLDLRIRYVCSTRNYDPDALENRLGADDPILLHGGGNLGDLWPQHERFREQVVTDFPQRRVVQLPQSIHFESPANARRAREVLTTHERFRLFVRDRQSQQIAHDRLEIPAVLCPDAALLIQDLPTDPSATAAPAGEVLGLLRTDQEANLPNRLLSDTLERRDWIRPRPHLPHEHTSFTTRLRRAVSAKARRALKQTVEAAQPTRIWRYRQMSTREVTRGLRLLQRGRIVVTDRLHGHVLSLLLGKPHVILDNSYGKISTFHEVWTQGLEAVRFATDGSQVESLIDELLALVDEDQRE